MKTLFQMQGRSGRLVQVDLNQKNVDDKLFFWLKEKHNEIFWDLEMHEGGSVNITKYTEGFTITFRGDNGIFEMEEVIVQTV
jgi:hypothetical protein